MSKTTGVVISGAQGISDSAFDDTVRSFLELGFEVETERRGSEVYASFLLLVSTGFVIYLLKPFTDKFIGKLGEDIYTATKPQLEKLWQKCFSSEREIKGVISGSQNKIYDTGVSLDVSFISIGHDGQVFKLVFFKETPLDSFTHSLQLLYRALEQRRLRSIDGNLYPSPPKAWGQRVLLIENNEVFEIDIVESSLQKKLILVPFLV